MMRIDSTTIYLTDNGRALCGEHLGVSARTTGRDISGQEIMPITPEIAAITLAEYGPRFIPQCGNCGRVASMLDVRI